MIGVGLSFLIANGLAQLPDCRGAPSRLHGGRIRRALLTALAMTLLGGVYPTARAACLSPLKALSYE